MTEQERLDTFINELSKFMQNTNQIIAKLMLQINNLSVDIDKLKKENKNRIIIPH
jgi:uncharacterized HAD superfamily protein